MGMSSYKRQELSLSADLTLPPKKQEVVNVDLEGEWAESSRVWRHPEFEDEDILMVEAKVGEYGKQLNLTFKNNADYEVTIDGAELVVIVSEDPNEEPPPPLGGEEQPKEAVKDKVNDELEGAKKTDPSVVASDSIETPPAHSPASYDAADQNEDKEAAKDEESEEGNEDTSERSPGKDPPVPNLAEPASKNDDEKMDTEANEEQAEKEPSEEKESEKSGEEMETDESGDKFEEPVEGEKKEDGDEKMEDADEKKEDADNKKEDGDEKKEDADEEKEDGDKKMEDGDEKKDETEAT